MADHDDEEKKSADPLASIAQIEALGLPKRGEKRRSVYIGEQVICTLRGVHEERRVEVVDITSRGLALVEPIDQSAQAYAIGQRVTLGFERGQAAAFSVVAVIRNIGRVQFAGKAYRRLGLSFDMQMLADRDEMHAAIPGPVLGCRTSIRPQASCRDLFFFSELVLFQVEAFAPTGMELVVSERCKSLLPNQPFVISVHVPGRGTFDVPVINSAMQVRCANNRYRIFVRYQDAPPLFLEAVSEYLVMFGQDITPTALRKAGFKVGDFALAFELAYARADDPLLASSDLRATAIALPLQGGRQSAASPYSRKLICKIGPHFVAAFALTFVDGKRERSRLAEGGHQLRDELIQQRHVELTDFRMNTNAHLMDVLLPVLRHAVRIAIQARSKYLVLESTSDLVAIMQKVGFREHGSVSERRGRDGSVKIHQLMQLDVTQALFNKDRALSEQVWRKVYSDLFTYFKNKIATKTKTSKTSA